MSGRGDTAAGRTTPAARVAVLGTIGRLSPAPLPSDLARLRSLIEALEPDLLGVEVDPNDWEAGRLDAAPADVREALLPAARLTDTVVLPLGAPSPAELAPPERGPLAALRAAAMRRADGLLAVLHRAAGGPQGMDRSPFRHLCHLVCGVEVLAAGEAGRRAWQATNERLLARLLWAVRRDPGRRVLVAVQCRRVPWLEARLRPLRAELTLVRYPSLCGERAPDPRPAKGLAHAGQRG